MNQTKLARVPGNIATISQQISARRKRAPLKSAVPAPAPSHPCRWPGCGVQVAARFWGCTTHSARMPIEMRERLYELYHPRQDTIGRPSPAYIEHVTRMDAWARLNCDPADIQQAYALPTPTSASAQTITARVRSIAARLVAEKHFATAAEIVEATGFDSSTVSHALTTDDTLTRRMDYARKSGAKQFLYERRDV
jgi:hypothetical protein